MDTSISKKIHDRFADAVIGGQPEHFDAIEIQGARSDGDIGVTTDNANPEFYSVFLHYGAGAPEWLEGVQCCGDFTERAEAQAYAAELSAQYGWPVRDYTETEAKP